MLLLALFTLVAKLALVIGFDANSKSNVAVYWGQSSAGSQESLASYCQSSDVDIVLLSFMYSYPSSIGLDFSSACSDSFSDGLLHCDQIGEDIKTCQDLGKKVLLSMGGATGSYGFSSDSEAEQFATTLWNTFGGGSATERPFNDAIVDGFDFDIENQKPTGYAALAKKLRKYFNSASKDYYLSAAPQCFYPDASVGDLLNNADIDFAFIQFYNNYCNVDKQFNWDTWTQFASSAPNPSIKLYLGLPGSATAAGSGYLSDLSLVKSTVESISESSNFGGIMLWDASQSFGNEVDGKTYISQMKSILESVDSSGTSSTTVTSSSSIATSSTQSSSSIATSAPQSSSSIATSAPQSSSSIATSSTQSSSSIATSSTQSSSSIATSSTQSSSSIATSAPQSSSSIATSTSQSFATPSTLSSSSVAVYSSSSHSAIASSAVSSSRAPTFTSVSLLSSGISFSSTSVSSIPASHVHATQKSTSSALVVVYSSTAVQSSTPSSIAVASSTEGSSTAQASQTLTSTSTNPSAPYTTGTSSPLSDSSSTRSDTTTTLAPTIVPSDAPTATSSTASTTSTSWAHQRATELNAQYAAGQLNGNSSCFDGEISCSTDGKIAICDHGSWVFTECASGTVCFAYDSNDVVFTTCNFSYMKSSFV
ncbi:LADA_0F04786g1_1 [Lachancea dasiensis]|uniref:chitinase n=1 Tax=Lachancea dasiensis TaxID=1072105 RepID=A0A1G4JJI5_9SACH|nr:LADA_0F04786g1_1 [Lachancea dasiensis]